MAVALPNMSSNDVGHLFIADIGNHPANFGISARVHGR